MSTAPSCAPVNGYPRMHTLDDGALVVEPEAGVTILYRSEGALGHVTISTSKSSEQGQ